MDGLFPGIKTEADSGIRDKSEGDFVFVVKGEKSLSRVDSRRTQVAPKLSDAPGGVKTNSDEKTTGK